MATTQLTLDEIVKAMGDLENCLLIQGMNGNWNYDPYMHGMYNGLALAYHIISGAAGEPAYKNAPKRWLSEPGG